MTKIRNFIIFGVLFSVVAALGGAAQQASAYWNAPTISNIGWCQNTLPSNWKTTLTNNYGYIDGMDLYIGCSYNSGRDFVYIFGTELYYSIGSAYPWQTSEFQSNKENIAWKDGFTGKLIYQNNYNGQWYDQTSTRTATGDLNGITYRSVIDVPLDNHNPIYTSGAGTFTLLNPFGITDFTIYNQIYLTETQAPEILSWGFIANVNNKQVDFVSQAGNAIDGGDIVKFEYDYLNNGTSYTNVTNNIQHTGSVLQHIEFGGWFMSHSYIFDNYGTYDVYMRVTDSNGKTAITHKLINVNGETNSYITDLNNGELNPPSTSELINGCAIQPDFPYFNITECTSSMGKALGLLKIDSNALKISGKGIDQQYSGCHYLSTIGDWLNTPNVQICPQFSSEVRDTVSPFVGFMLGLIGLNFIVKRGKNEGDI